ncbi:MAG: molybdenum cofactor biosynthesis protein B [Proteobacteria bacterium]|nr:molybdenum cofactor biosynthesis protein B [Pseudomonadota bacterium]
MAGIDAERPFVPVSIAILTMSDSRTLAEDTSGSYLERVIGEAGHALADRKIVKDDTIAIRNIVEGWIADPAIDCVITTGGTGFTGRDVTPEAVKPLFEKEIDGFAILFHMLSYQKVGTSTIQSRACGGVARGTYIFCLPGSTGACKDAWEGILQFQLDARHRPCNFVEIMPRLEEHRKTA